jgi:hypothetical protein
MGMTAAARKPDRPSRGGMSRDVGVHTRRQSMQFDMMTTVFAGDDGGS